MNPALFVEDGTASIHGHGKLPSGKDKVQICQAAVVGTDLFDITCGFLAQAGQDDLDLLLLFGVQFL